MPDIFENLYKASKGLTRLKKEDIENVFNELKNRGEVEEKDKDLFISKLIDSVEETGKKVKNKIKKSLNPNLDKLEQMNEKIDALMKEVEKLKGKKEG